MRRHLARLVVGAVAGSLVVAVPAVHRTASARTADETYGARTVLAGGGYGWSGPASRATLGIGGRADVAPNGLVVANGTAVLRVDTTTDRVAVLARLSLAYESWRFRDVASRGEGAVVLTETEVLDVSTSGVATRLASVTHGVALDVGSDGVVWVATRTGVLRILPDGTVLSPAPVATFSSLVDLAVVPDGSRAFVVDSVPMNGGIWEVRPEGVGARVAGAPSGNGLSIATGVAADQANVRGVLGLATDGTRVHVTYGGKVASFAPGGTFTVHLDSGGYEWVDVQGSALVLGRTLLTSGRLTWVRWTGPADAPTRLFGPDSTQEWSPDGVRADDAYLGEVRGVARRPGGPLVLTTKAGQVREVGADGLLRTRATLDRLVHRGQVAVGPDGAAYVITDTGSVVRVPAVGSPTTLALDADVVDVEVAADGALVAADARGRRVLRMTSSGAVSVLAFLTDAPSGLALDGSDVLVAGAGLRRVTPAGVVTTVLTGGAAGVATSSDGIWVDVPTWGGWFVMRPGGVLSPVRPLVDQASQVSSDDAGEVMFARYGEAGLVTDPGLPAEPSATTVTATGGAGRITLGWDAGAASQVAVVGKRGTTAPRDFWDGQYFPDQALVLRAGETPLVPGETWSFTVFAMARVPVSPSMVTSLWWPLGSASAAAATDTTPPPPAVVELTSTQTWITVGWRTPDADDVDRFVARMALGTSAPLTPRDGTEIGSSLAWSGGGGAQIPDPVKGQDYAVSVFTYDTQGNWSRWSGVVGLDFDPPAAPTNLRVTPTFRSAEVTFMAPADADYVGITYAYAAGDTVPQRPDPGYPYPYPGTVTAFGLTMDTDYTLAIWAHDKNGNVGEPGVIRFRTPLDTTPPGAAGNLVATGGSYRVDATWTPPTDADLSTQDVSLLAEDGAVVSGPLGITKTTASQAFTRLPGGRSYRVKVVATDANGLRSEAVSNLVSTAPDANGAPPAVDPTTVTVTPASSATVAVSFPRPAIPDLRTLAYAFLPVGASPDSVTSVTSLSTASNPVRATLTLPSALTEYQLVLFVYDHNGNRSRSVVLGVKGAVTALDLPPAPVGVSATSPSDNTLTVSWTTASNPAVPAAEWVIALTSGALTRTVVVPGGDRAVTVRDLAGRVGWTASVAGRVALGAGPAKASMPVSVDDTTAPALATSLKATPSYDTQTLTWVNPTTFDFSHVVVTQKGATAADTKELYRGKGTAVKASGLRPAGAYTYEVATYDGFGQTAATPATLAVTQAEVLVHMPRTARYGIPETATNQVLFTGRPVVGKKVVVQAQKVGSTTWSTVATPTTNSTGHFLYTVQPAVSTRYRFGFAGVTGIGGAWSTTTTVTLAPAISVRTSRNNFGLGGTATLSTTVAPNHRGRTILLQRWNGSAWKTLTSRVLSSTSTASATVRPPVRGVNSYRWLLAAHTDHGTGTSATMRLTVR